MNKLSEAAIGAANIFNTMIPKKLPYQKFLDSFKYAPRPAVNLLVIRENGAILLTKRKKPPFAGDWHLPGSFILKGESLMDCVKRVAEEELGVEIETKIKVKKVRRLTGLRQRQDVFTLVGVFDDIDGDPRGHVVDLVYQIRPGPASWQAGPFRPVGDSAEIRFFKKLPQNIGFNHRETLSKLGYL